MDEAPAILPIVVSSLAPIAIVAWFAFVTAVIAQLGGWARLAERYRTELPRPDNARLTSGRMRWMTGYNSVLYVGWTDAGLYLSVFPLFRAGHPPLLVPWSDVEVLRRNAGLLVKMTELRLGGTIPLSVRASALEGAPLPA